MRDVTALVERDEIHAYFKALWRTPEFQGSHVPGGYVFGGSSASPTTRASSAI